MLPRGREALCPSIVGSTYEAITVQTVNMRQQIVLPIKGSVATPCWTDVRMRRYMHCSHMPNQIRRSTERTIVFASSPFASAAIRHSIALNPPTCALNNGGKGKRKGKKKEKKRKGQVQKKARQERTFHPFLPGPRTPVESDSYQEL